MLATLIGVALATSVVSSTTTNAHAKQRVMEEFQDVPAMIDVAYCESTFQHWQGTSTDVLRGKVVKADIGIFQINERYHRADAEKIGLNIDDLEDNIAYAKVLYIKNGLQPWSASHDCMNERAKLRQLSE